MSRCFPYRPTGCVRNGTSGEVLIESIKLQREKEKTKTDPRKEKKREKKEKREERRQKKAKLYNLSDGTEAGKLNKEKGTWDRGCHVKRSEDEETERLEKSTLTEEHDEPVSRPKLCYLSDGTQSSNKRKRDSPPSNGTAVHRNIIWIRVPSQKQCEANASRSEEQSCSTSGRALESLVQRKETVGGQCLRTKNTEAELIAMSDLVRNENIAQCSRQTACGATIYENKMQRKGSIYKALIEDWVPPILPCEPNDGDNEEWLFGAKTQVDESKRFKTGKDVSLCQTSWLSADYLPDVDMYALPYSIPL